MTVGLRGRAKQTLDLVDAIDGSLPVILLLDPPNREVGTLLGRRSIAPVVAGYCAVAGWLPADTGLR